MAAFRPTCECLESRDFPNSLLGLGSILDAPPPLSSAPMLKSANQETPSLSDQKQHDLIILPQASATSVLAKPVINLKTLDAKALVPTDHTVVDLLASAGMLGQSSFSSCTSGTLPMVVVASPEVQAVPVNTAASITVQYADPGPSEANYFRIRVDWADGYISNFDLTDRYVGTTHIPAPSAGGYAFAGPFGHAYASPGDYQVAVRVTENGCYSGEANPAGTDGVQIKVIAV